MCTHFSCVHYDINVYTLNRSRYANNKRLLERASLIEEYLEITCPRHLDDARFFAELTLAYKEGRLQTINEGFAPCPAELLTYDEIQALLQPSLEPLDLPEEFFADTTTEINCTANVTETVTVAQEDNGSFDAPVGLVVPPNCDLFDDLDTFNVTVTVAQEDNGSFEVPTDLVVPLDSDLFDDLDVLFSDITDLF